MKGEYDSAFELIIQLKMINSSYPFEFIRQDQNTLVFINEDSETTANVTVLEDNIIRVWMYRSEPEIPSTWLVSPGMEDIPKEGRSRRDYSGFSLPSFQFSIAEDGYIIETEALTVKLSSDSLKAAWFVRGDRHPYAEDRRTQNVNVGGELGKGIFHYMHRDKDDMYFGLGEKTGNTNRHGNTYKMMSLDPMGYDAQTTDPLYKHIPFYMVKSAHANVFYGMFYDNLSTSIFDMGKEMDNYHGLYRKYTAESGDLDYYMILGPSVDRVVKTYSWMTGKTRMMPKWSIGYSGSTMTYTDMDDAQEQLKKFVDDCRRHDIPCDSFQLSSGYTSIGDKRYVFNWNYDKVPAPKEMASHFHENGLRLCANIKPALLTDHPQFADLEEKGYFIKSADGDRTEIAQFWDDLGAYVDFTNPSAYDWWKSQVTEALLEVGIDATWNDNNEYEVWDSAARINGFGKGMTIGDARPLQPLLMMKASYEAQRDHSPEVRPYLISRSGCPGMQRYVQTWSGDNNTSWKSLKYNIKMGIGLSLSGVYNTGHDVGGFAGEAPSPELLNRWVQNGIFHPRFTIHSWNSDKTVNVPWMYASELDSIRDAIKFRTKLTPYLYSLLFKAHDSYEPMLRPTFYNYPQDRVTYKENDDFMLGRDLLIGSVVEEGARTREIYLPIDSNGWMDYYSEDVYTGGQTVTVEAPMSHGALFVRLGAVVPLNTAEITFDKKEDDERTLQVYAPDMGNIEGFLYEDDGYTTAYEKGCCRKIFVTGTSWADCIKLYARSEGSYALPYDKIALEIRNLCDREVYFNDKLLSSNRKGMFNVSDGDLNA